MSAEYSLTSLLPYDQKDKFGDRFLSGVKEYLHVLYATRNTIDFFNKKQLNHFDPLVGENACQIRALRIIDIAKHLHISEHLYPSLLQAIENLQMLILSNTHSKMDDLSVHDYILQENLNIYVNKELIFLITSYILTTSKLTMDTPKHELFDKVVTKPTLIRNISDVPASFAERFVRKLRIDLSRDSTEYIMQLNMKDSIDIYCNEVISKNYSYMHIGLYCLPYYWTTKVVVAKIIREKIPIIVMAEQRLINDRNVIINREILFYEAVEESYIETYDTNRLQDKYAMIIQANSFINPQDKPNNNWLDELRSYSIIELILAHAASHRQYPNISQEEILSSIDDESYRYYKSKADVWGCSMNNPSLLFINHFYCDLVKNCINAQDITMTADIFDDTLLTP